MAEHMSVWRVVVVLVLVSLSLAQSAGGHGGGSHGGGSHGGGYRAPVHGGSGAATPATPADIALAFGLVGIIFVVVILLVCLLFMTDACTKFIYYRCMARKARKGHLACVQGYAGAEELPLPRSGLFKGEFQQGSTKSPIEVHLNFLKRKDLRLAGHPVALYEVIGEGTDSFGTWKIQRGECRVGSSVVLAFYKKYITSSAPTTNYQRLMYVCHMQLEDWTGSSFSGTWEFVKRATPRDLTPMTGQWSIQFSSASSGQSFGTPTDSTPLLGNINLTKGNPLPLPV